MIITLDEMKNYLRVDHEDDDILLESLIASSQQLWMWLVSRMKNHSKKSHVQKRLSCMQLHICTNTGKMQTIWN